MLNDFQPQIVIIGLGGNDSYGYYNKETKYKTVLAGWMSAFEAANVEEVRFLGPSYATKIMDNGRSYDTIRQKIRDHQNEFVSSYSGPIKTSWNSTVPLTKDLDLKDGVHFVSGAQGLWCVG